MRPLLVPLMLAAVAGGATLFPATAATGAATTQIYLQRGADGRPLLTDRPSPTSLTERTWQMEREDPAEARRRAADVQREAEQVSERIRLRQEAEQRRADMAAMQTAYERELQERLARIREENATSYVGSYPYYPYYWNRWNGSRRGPPFTDHPGQPKPTPHRTMPRNSRPSGPESPESR
jgi:hypothetical protein